jgi:hypothetical protein
MITKPPTNNRFRARHNGRNMTHKDGMNKTEAAYATHLSWRQTGGEILGFAFEAVKFRLADKTFYTPDFIVYAGDGTVEIHEVKGHWEDDARVKIKVFASLFPFKVIAVKRTKTGWETEDFTHG